jgi:hypothetical protein
MELEIYKERFEVLRSYYPEDGKVDFEFPVLLHGTKIAFKSRSWPNNWNVGWIKVHPNMLTIHWVSTVNYIFIDDSPDYYRYLWMLNLIDQFGTLIELHILKSPEVKL